MLEGESKYIPIKELSAVSVKSGNYLMILKAYFDGSGLESDPNCTHVTLASICARSDEWEIFEKKWEKALLKHNAPKSSAGNPYWHTVEAVGRNKGFYKWDIEKVKELMVDLLKAIHSMPKNTITMIASTIRMEDYREVKKEIPLLMPHQAISVFGCASFIIQKLKKKEKRISSLELFFDNNESYSEYMRKIIKLGASWTKYIAHIGDTYIANQLYPLQACDLLGWLLSRYHSNRSGGGWNKFTPALILLAPLCNHLYDAKTLHSVFDENGKFRDKFKIDATPLSCPVYDMIKWKDLFYGKETSDE